MTPAISLADRRGRRPLLRREPAATAFAGPRGARAARPLDDSVRSSSSEAPRMAPRTEAANIDARSFRRTRSGLGMNHDISANRNSRQGGLRACARDTAQGRIRSLPRGLANAPDPLGPRDLKPARGIRTQAEVAEWQTQRTQ